MLKLVRELGFEPRLAESKAAVLNHWTIPDQKKVTGGNDEV